MAAAGSAFAIGLAGLRLLQFIKRWGMDLMMGSG